MHRDILNESITVESNQASVFAALTIYFRLNNYCNEWNYFFLIFN